MTYSTITQIQNRLANVNLGVSGAHLVTDTQIAEMQDEANATINVFLDVDTDVTITRYVVLLRRIEIDVVAMMILQSRMFKEQNRVCTVSNYWTVTPELTRAHEKTLRMIRNRMRSDTAYNYSIRTGEKTS